MAETHKGRFSCIYNSLICCLRPVKLRSSNYISINETILLFLLHFFLERIVKYFEGFSNHDIFKLGKGRIK